MNLIYAMACHFIGDFPLQSEFLALNKGKSTEIMIYHVAIYTSLFILLGATAVQCSMIFFTHYIIDNLKARYGIIKSIWFDQLLHMTVLVVLFVR